MSGVTKHITDGAQASSLLRTDCGTYNTFVLFLAFMGWDGMGVGRITLRNWRLAGLANRLRARRTGRQTRSEGHGICGVASCDDDRFFVFGFGERFSTSSRVLLRLQETEERRTECLSLVFLFGSISYRVLFVLFGLYL